MILDIVLYPNSILRKKSEKIKEITPEIRQLALDMIETMIKNNGLGLAAPQVNELKQMMVVHLIKNRSPDERVGLEPKILINPRIVGKSREAEIGEEGCLCAPGIFLKIKRAISVEVSALDIDGKEIQIKTEGLPARILQHEIDHLNGILFFDKIPFWQRLTLKKKLKNASN